MSISETTPAHTLSVAPMMDWTDQHCRAFHRILTCHTLLYTEMVTTGAILFGGAERFLAYGETEHPVALQLGGHEAEALAKCTRLAHEYGYDEINLNCGCPSNRVQNGAFGACLMKTPEHVAQLLEAMQRVTERPVTVKHRIGVDDLDHYEHLQRFVRVIADVGVQTFIVHARKAWLSGLSPKENREIPPLRYDVVQQLKAEFPQLTIVLNGGIQNLDEAKQALEWADGVMIGRAAYRTPYILAQADQHIFGQTTQAVTSRTEAVRAYFPYVQAQLALGQPLHRLTKPLLGLFHQERGTKHWKRLLSTKGYEKNAGLEVLEEAVCAMEALSNE